MKKFAIAGVAALAIAGSTAVYAQHRSWFHGPMRHMQLSPEDRAAFTDARIAAVHAGLKLNAGSGKALAAGGDGRSGFREAAGRASQCADERGSQPGRPEKSDNPVERLRRRRRQHDQLSGGPEEDRGRGRPALQDPRRGPETPPGDPDAYGRHGSAEDGAIGGFDRGPDGETGSR